ncbi:MAG TPA: DUF1122 family protein [Anaerolineae bacterium]|nr:DUF1122 family protein [Anaerolineae bacterium]
MSPKSALVDTYLRTELDGKRVDAFFTELSNVRRLRFIEERYFELYLKSKDGRRSYRPVIRGIYFPGRGRWIKPWMEITYNPKLALIRAGGRVCQVDISDTRSEECIFNLLSEMIPPGGRLMVEYSMKDHPETAKALEAGAPPILTKLGHLLWKSGFTSFKDWYFAEGWLEGNTKLQGEKPLDEEVKRRHIKRNIAEIKKFLASGKSIQGLVQNVYGLDESQHEGKSM